MKLIGAVTLIFGAVYIGIKINKTSKLRIIMLDNLSKAFSAMKMKISSGICTTQCALSEIGRDGLGNVGEFFRSVANEMGSIQSFSDIWESKAAQLEGINEDELEYLISIGEQLGSMYSEQLKICLDAASGYFESQYNAEKKDFDLSYKLTLYIPASLACLVIILLM